MSPLSVIITIAAYFAILFTVSYIAGRKADNAGFFVGNRKSSWYVVAFAMIGSSISGVTYVSVPGMVAASNFGYLQMVLGFIAGQLIIAFVLTPLFYRMNRFPFTNIWRTGSACPHTVQGPGFSSSPKCLERQYGCSSSA